MRLLKHVLAISGIWFALFVASGFMQMNNAKITIMGGERKDLVRQVDLTLEKLGYVHAEIYSVVKGKGAPFLREGNLLRVRWEYPPYPPVGLIVLIDENINNIEISFSETSGRFTKPARKAYEDLLNALSEQFGISSVAG